MIIFSVQIIVLFILTSMAHASPRESSGALISSHSESYLPSRTIGQPQGETIIIGQNSQFQVILSNSIFKHSRSLVCSRRS
ncbi:hypothetical protein GGS26DRAFT_560579 [Hypomontagnella submonticulosa]|nr:hypothetical protein GGS26DRAFT_560579 [Hypomontagnella submonticulosa]